MATYKLQMDPISNTVNAVLLDNTKHIPFDEKNIDYQEYLEWLAEGNTPTPADS